MNLPTSRHDERDIARRLADTPVGEPPPELLDRLRADIPEDLAAPRSADVAETSNVVPFSPFARPWLAAAAVLVMLLGGGFLAWKLSQSVAPVDSMRMDGPVAGEATRSAEPKASRDAEASGEPASELAEGRDEHSAAASAPTARDESALAPRAEEIDAADATAFDDSASDRRFSAEQRRQSASEQARERGLSAPPSRADADAFYVPDPTPDAASGSAGAAGGEPTAVAGQGEEIDVIAEAPEIRATATHGVVPKPRSAAPPPAHAVPAPPPTALKVPDPARRVRRVTPPPPRATSDDVSQENLSISADNPAARRLEEDLAELEMELQRLEPAVEPEPALPPVHPVIQTSEDRLSTFGLDVDTGSWTLLRDRLRSGRRPPPAAVRVEEVVNAQPYSDPFAGAPARPGETFRLTADGAPSPFAPSPGHRLLRFRVSARDLPAAERKPVILTLVVDVSGSMEGQGLDLVRAGVERLLEALRPGDRVALVTFSDQARVVAGHGDPAALRRAVAELASEGGTNAEAGLRAGYELATAAFDPAAANRVILLSDGLANMGAVTADAIRQRVARAAAEGIELTTVGVGQRDFNDALMESLADRGDGRYAYAADRREMERLFVEELDGTLQTVAEEARAQVEFDPAVVESWRQIGYENRAIADHEFRYDSVDAGEIGPRHSVTALYEVKLRAAAGEGKTGGGGLSRDATLALLKLRWREPAGADGTPGRYREVEERLRVSDLAPAWTDADPDLRLAAVAAELAEQLRGSSHTLPGGGAGTSAAADAAAGATSDANADATASADRLSAEARRLVAPGVPGAAELAELAAAWAALR